MILMGKSIRQIWVNEADSEQSSCQAHFFHKDLVLKLYFTDI